MLADLLKTVAPGLATLVTGPLGGMAVKAIADKLGVPADELSITEAIKADPDAALKLREIDVRELEAHNANTDSARQMNAAIQESANAAWLAKNVAYILDVTIIGATLLMTWFLFIKGVPPENKELAYMAFGSLITLCGTVVNFHRGSSQGSKDKAQEIQALKGSK